MQPEHRLARMLSKISDRIEISHYLYGGVLDFNRAMTLEIDYRVPQYALPVDGGLEFKSPVLQLTRENSLLFRAGSYDWPEKRRDDVFFYFTELLNCEETISLPGGLTVTDPKKSDEIDETYAYFKGESAMIKKGLAVTQTAAVKRRQIPNDGYAGLRKTMEEFKKFGETVFRAEKGGAK